MVAHQVITSADELARCLDTELKGFRDFVQALQSEQEALVQGDVDNLLELARIKSEKVVFLTQLAEQRNRFLAAQDANPESGGMTNWLHQQKTSQTTLHIAKTWKQLLEQAEIAQQLNQVNGTLIESRLRHNQQALAVLQKAANQGVSLYGPDGQTHASGMGRPIGKV